LRIKAHDDAAYASYLWYRRFQVMCHFDAVVLGTEKKNTETAYLWSSVSDTSALYQCNLSGYCKGNSSLALVRVVCLMERA